MRVGSIGYCTEQGLGYLLKDFYDHGIVDTVALVQHGKRPEHPEWFPNCDYINYRSVENYAAWLIKQAIDVMFFFETPFCWELIPYCQKCGIKTILMPMYECMPERLPYEPDLILCPSLLDLQYYPAGRFVPVPVEVTWMERCTATTFLHNAGWGGLRGRNGTAELMLAWLHVESPAKLIIHSQESIKLGGFSNDWMQRNEAGGSIEVRTGTFPRHTLYDEGDVFIFPEKFNGLSLPIQEAYASGMLMMCSNRFPNNAYLPLDPLIPVHDYTNSRVGRGRMEFREAIISPRDIARTIDDWYGKDINAYSERGKIWAEANSWENLRGIYQEIIGELARSH
jgi:hypothetical protein